MTTGDSLGTMDAGEKFVIIFVSHNEKKAFVGWNQTGKVWIGKFVGRQNALTSGPQKSDKLPANNNILNLFKEHNERHLMHPLSPMTSSTMINDESL